MHGFHAIGRETGVTLDVLCQRTDEAFKWSLWENGVCSLAELCDLALGHNTASPPTLALLCDCCVSTGLLACLDAYGVRRLALGILPAEAEELSSETILSVFIFNVFVCAQ